MDPSSYGLQVASRGLETAIRPSEISYLLFIICHFIRALGENEYGFTYGISSTWTIRSPRFVAEPGNHDLRRRDVLQQSGRYGRKGRAPSSGPLSGGRCQPFRYGQHLLPRTIRRDSWSSFGRPS